MVYVALCHLYFRDLGGSEGTHLRYINPATNRAQRGFALVGDSVTAWERFGKRQVGGPVAWRLWIGCLTSPNQWVEKPRARISTQPPGEVGALPHEFVCILRDKRGEI